MKKQEDEILDLEGMIKELELKLERLKVMYEQYFMGIVKREPLVLKKDVVRIMRALDQVKIRNTGLKFRLRMIVQRFNSYRTYWSRTLRAIDNGSYHRDVARVSRKMERRGISMPPKGKMRTAAEVERAITQAFQQAKDEEGAGEKQQASEDKEARTGLYEAVPPTPSVASAPGPASAGSLPRPASVSPPRAPAARRPGSSSRPYPSTDPLSDEQMKSIYRRFVKAKKMCGEDINSIHYETLAKSLTQQLPKIQAQHQGKRVEFQVVIRAGRAIIRAQGKE